MKLKHTILTGLAAVVLLSMPTPVLAENTQPHPPASACAKGTAPAAHMREGGFCDMSRSDRGSINTMGPANYTPPAAPVVVVPAPLTKRERIEAALRAAYEAHQAEIEAAAQRIRDRLAAWRDRWNR